MMTNLDADKQTCLQVFDEAIRQLPPNLAQALSPHRSGPKLLKKRDTNIMRLRILPRTKAPISFWNSGWCFYEIGVGSYSPREAEGVNLGGIQFFQNPNMKVCGSGIYRRQVVEIVRRLEQARPGFVCEIGESGKIHFGRRYLLKDYPTYPVSVASEDLAWLIKETLPRFQAICIGG